MNSMESKQRKIRRWYRWEMLGDIFSYDEDRDYSEEPVEKERR